MVRRDVAGAKIARATSWIDDAAARFGDDVDAFVADRDRRDLAIFYLFLAIQECIDLAADWVVDAGWLTAEDAGSTFDELASRGALTPELATTLTGAVARIHEMMLRHRWEVFFITQRPNTEFRAGLLHPRAR